MSGSSRRRIWTGSGSHFWCGIISLGVLLKLLAIGPVLNTMNSITTWSWKTTYHVIQGIMGEIREGGL